MKYFDETVIGFWCFIIGVLIGVVLGAVFAGSIFILN